MQTDHLPPGIVAPLLAVAEAVSGWAADHPDSTLAEQEAAVLSAWRAHSGAVLHGVVQQTQRSLHPSAARLRPRCPRCAARCRRHSWRLRQVVSLCGTMRYERPWYSCRGCGQGFSPTDATLGLAPQQRLSTALHELVVALGGACPFAEATRLLARTTGLCLSAETVRAHTEAAGTALAAAHAAAVASARATRIAPHPLVPVAGRLVAQTDGVMMRFGDGWHEVKVGLVGGWQGADGRARLQGMSYVAAREPAASFAQRWGAEAARRGAWEVIGWRGVGMQEAVLPTVVVLGDGARWIWEAAAEQFGDRIEIVDFYHAAEHLGTVAHACFGEGAPAATAWAQTRRHEVLTGGVQVILDHLRALQPTTALARDVVRQARGYFTTNAARMDYPAFRAQGLPIGSGAVESSAKHLIQHRLKRAGQRWSDAGGAALIALRAHQATAIAQAA
jgi:hypothetical protein